MVDFDTARNIPPSPGDKKKIMPISIDKRQRMVEKLKKVKTLDELKKLNPKELASGDEGDIYYFPDLELVVKHWRTFHKFGHNVHYFDNKSMRVNDEIPRNTEQGFEWYVNMMQLSYEMFPDNMINVVDSSFHKPDKEGEHPFCLTFTEYVPIPDHLAFLRDQVYEPSPEYFKQFLTEYLITECGIIDKDPKEIEKRIKDKFAFDITCLQELAKKEPGVIEKYLEDDDIEGLVDYIFEKYDVGDDIARLVMTGLGPMKTKFGEYIHDKIRDQFGKKLGNKVEEFEDAGMVVAHPEMNATEKNEEVCFYEIYSMINYSSFSDKILERFEGDYDKLDNSLNKILSMINTEVQSLKHGCNLGNILRGLKNVLGYFQDRQDKIDKGVLEELLNSEVFSNLKIDLVPLLDPSYQTEAAKVFPPGGRCMSIFSPDDYERKHKVSSRRGPIFRSLLSKRENYLGKSNIFNYFLSLEEGKEIKKLLDEVFSLIGLDKKMEI